jgi:hypothetical protein
MSRASGRNWVVRHNDRQVSRIICTATPEGIAWPRLASPPVPIAEATGDREREHPGRDAPAAQAGLSLADYTRPLQADLEAGA